MMHGQQDSEIVFFESHRGHECLSVVSVMGCQVEVSARSWSIVQMSPTACGASLCVIKKPEEWGCHSPRWGAAPEIKQKSNVSFSPHYIWTTVALLTSIRNLKYLVRISEVTSTILKSIVVFLSPSIQMWLTVSFHIFLKLLNYNTL